MTILIALLWLTGTAEAGGCSADARARVDSAEQLMVEARQAPAVDKAAVLERARILLERTLKDDPNCRSAARLKTKADELKDDMEALSSAAAREEVLARATRYVTAMEENGVTDYASLEALRFQIAALGDYLPDDERVEDLARRAAALGEKG